MRSYDEYCALAKALDVVGDRWSLLIVRELLTKPCRYRDLQDNLPGVATNLLAERLRHLEASGVLEPGDDNYYSLTAWGEQLAAPAHALARWASPLMATMEPDDAFRGHWLAFPIAFIFGGIEPSRPDFVAEIRAGSEPVTMESAGGTVQFRPGPANSPNVVISGSPEVIVGILAGRLDKKSAVNQGASILGDIRPLARLRQADWMTGPESCPTPARSAAT